MADNTPTPRAAVVIGRIKKKYPLLADIEPDYKALNKLGVVRYRASKRWTFGDEYCVSAFWVGVLKYALQRIIKGDFIEVPNNEFDILTAMKEGELIRCLDYPFAGFKEIYGGLIYYPGNIEVHSNGDTWFMEDGFLTIQKYAHYSVREFIDVDSGEEITPVIYMSDWLVECIDRLVRYTLINYDGTFVYRYATTLHEKIFEPMRDELIAANVIIRRTRERAARIIQAAWEGYVMLVLRKGALYDRRSAELFEGCVCGSSS